MKYGYNDLQESYRKRAKCALCDNLSFSDKKKDYNGKETFKCKATGKYVKLDKDICKSVKIAEENKKKLGTYTAASASDCYITTIVCEVLGYEDDCELLNTLRNFRDNYLKKDLNKHLPILQQYDFIGPMISNGIRNMEEIERKRYSLVILDYYLLPCVNYIKSNDYDKAIQTYEDMVLNLTTTFGISLTIGDNIPYDFELLGKGRGISNEDQEV